MAKDIITLEEFNRRIAAPLDIKIKWTVERIKEWYLAFNGMISVAVSGGKDSQVLLDIVRSIYPEVPGVFYNTGVEYPEVLHVVRRMDNVEWRRPAKTFPEIIQQYGYPVISKRVAQYVHEVKRSRGETATKRLRLTGIKTDGTFSKMGKIPDKWQFLIDAPFGISDKCCNFLKKQPAKAYEKETGRAPILGTMATEGKQREKTYLQIGCNGFDLKRPRSTPMAFWTDSDVWEYIARRGLVPASLYSRGYDRTGCAYCLFGIHMEGSPNRFERMKETHPANWRYAMDRLGMREVLNFIGFPAEDKQRKLF